MAHGKEIRCKIGMGNSGLRSPYLGKLGVVEENALADLILVDGDPFKDLSLLTQPKMKFIVIMKDGKIFKDISHR